MIISNVRSSLLVTSFALALALSATACPGPQSAPEGAGAGEPASPAPTDAPGALRAAHEAYLTGDFVAVGERIHDVLLDPASGQLAKDNALELLDRAYEATNGKLPSRFVFPAGITQMKVSTVRAQNVTSPWQSVFLWMRVREGLTAKMTNITVRRPDGEVFLDQASGRGVVSIKHYVPGFEDVVLERGASPTLPSDGVLTVRVDVAGVPLLDTWVIARNLVASATPQILSPQVSASLADANPVVSWVPFRSPQNAAYEERTLSVYVSDQASEKGVWDFWTGNAGELATVKIGDHASAPKARLEPASYWLALSAGEERFFGPIRMTRMSRAGVPFNVVPNAKP